MLVHERHLRRVLHVLLLLLLLVMRPGWQLGHVDHPFAVAVQLFAVATRVATVAGRVRVVTASPGRLVLLLLLLMLVLLLLTLNGIGPRRASAIPIDNIFHYY